MRERGYIEQEGGVMLNRKGGDVSRGRGGAVSSTRVESC